MHALATTSDAYAAASRSRFTCLDDLPDPAPLEMPAQSLTRAPHADQRLRSWQGSLRLGGLIAVTLLLTGLALAPVYRLLGADTIGPLDVVILALVGLLFPWTAFSFLSALAGFLVGRRGGLHVATDCPLPALACRNAVLLPVYNEAPTAVFARLQAMADSVEAAGAAEAFDFFVLSDSTDAEVQVREHQLYARLRQKPGRQGRVFYRHRGDNAGRKAGNIADWVRRFGGAYAHMVVLDADSLMEGETLVRLAGAMENAPDVGLIQTAPAIINRHSLFSRAEQFASRMYGPMLAHGVAWWSASEGNYWGHNAIIRVEAFARHAGLPQLRGPRPFGGHILSHDFVEAALLRRGGWRVCLASGLGGSYEESPPTLAGLMARDRRWSQGNLQHAQVLFARGLHWINRFHLLRGICAYLVSPLWLSLLACAVILPLRPDWGVSASASGRIAGAPPVKDLQAVGVTFAVSIGFLLLPKALAYLRMLRTAGARRGFGGARRAALSVAAETILSTLVAPLIMLSHSRSLAAALAGRDSGWTAQAREESGLDLARVAQLHAADTLLGLILTASALAVSVRAMLWMAPVVLGLNMAIPLAVTTASGRLGRVARDAAILITPEERRPPQILARANAHIAGWPPS